MNITEALAEIAKARAAGLAQIEAIKKERDAANAKWATDIEQIKESLRVRAKTERKPKPETTPEATPER